MNWQYDDALVTADRHVFFKYMVKTLAERRGYRATFMAQAIQQSDGQWLPHACLGLAGRQEYV